MTAVESMRIKILPLKSYDCNSGTNVSNEIESYGIALDEHREMLNELLRECFISTAESYGLENREIMVGDIKSGYPVERRREMMILRNHLGENDFTREGLEKFLKCFGITDFELTEMPSENELSIYVGGDYTAADRMWIARQISMMMPAHLIGTVTFKGLNWASIDSKNLTCAESDNKNYTWAYINNLV